jgi:hypothetical protein
MSVKGRTFIMGIAVGIALHYAYTNAKSGRD